MAYFSNGTEGDMFTEKNCDLCVHDLKDNCAIWFLHLTRNYEQCKDTPEGKATKEMLSTLIPVDADGFARKCNLFHPFTPEEKSAAYDETHPLIGKNKPAPWIAEWLKNKKPETAVLESALGVIGPIE